MWGMRDEELRAGCTAEGPEGAPTRSYSTSGPQHEVAWAHLMQVWSAGFWRDL